jgi:purine-binding chemotaxis protein CheW
MSAGVAVLFLQAGAHGCALPVREVIETMRPLPIAPLAGQPAWVCGLALVRGAPLPVVDLGCLIGGTPSSAVTRLVTVRAGDRQLALAVTHVAGVGTLPTGTMSALPALLGDTSAQALGAHAGELVQLLACARLLPEGAHQALDAAIGEARA